MNYYLIRFEYTYYAGGWEDGHETVLVKAKSFGAAINAIKIKAEVNKKWEDPREFENLTVDLDSLE